MKPAWLYTAGDTKSAGMIDLRQHVHVPDRAALADAAELLSTFGALAELEAAQRASRSRVLGNVHHFCRWRLIEHAIIMLRDEDAPDARH